MTKKKSQMESKYNGIVLFQNSKYSIELLDKIKGLSEKELVVVVSKWYTDYIMVYSDGSVAYDNPYKIADYIKEKVEHFAKKHITQLTF